MKFLFTSQASNDLGLLTRSLPIASELKSHGYEVAFCNPAKIPRLIIADAGFDSLIPKHPAYYLNHLLLQKSGSMRVSPVAWAFKTVVCRLSAARKWTLTIPPLIAKGDKNETP